MFSYNSDQNKKKTYFLFFAFFVVVAILKTLLHQYSQSLLLPDLLKAKIQGVAVQENNSQSGNLNNFVSEAEYLHRESTQTLDAVQYFDSLNFKKSIAQAKVINLEKAQAVIIPHHTLVANQMATVFQSISLIKSRKIKRIFILSPNHFETGSANFISNIYPWQTKFGIQEVDQDGIQHLKSKNYLALNQVLEKEHGIGGLLNYLKYYLPEVKVVPIMVSTKVTLPEIKKLIEKIHSQVGKETLLLASLDFSHYLTLAEADHKDTKTLEIVENFAVEQAYRLDCNDYVDSPAVLSGVLWWCHLQNCNNTNQIYHTNSGRILNQPYSETTSHFTFVFE